MARVGFAKKPGQLRRARAGFREFARARGGLGQHAHRFGHRIGEPVEVVSPLAGDLAAFLMTRGETRGEPR